MTSLPRLVVAAPASGHGKTTVATGLMAALARTGLVVSGHKVGPDYIDPGYHALATGRPGRNLDPHLVGEDLLVPLLLHGAAGADVALVEGVMGLYDGRLGGDGFASTAHVAAHTRSPVLLVVDISHASRSIAATVHGMTTWDPSVHVVGVILNKAGSTRHADEVVAALATSRVPVLGVLHRDDGIVAPSRHLGLVPAAERADAAASLDRLAAQVADRVDLEAVLRLAQLAPDLPDRPWAAPQPDVPRERPVVAVAGGRAFTFRYAETDELLRAAGCDVAVFDPTMDESLPEGTRALYLGGGFPEVHAADLSANDSLRRQVRDAVRAGLPTVAECAGLLYLARSVDGSPMSGALDVDAAMAPRLTLAYRSATAPTRNLLGRPGEHVTGHEFHRTGLLGSPGAPAWAFPDGSDGVATSTLHAAYLHTHWAGHPQLARRFATAARAAAPAPAARPARHAPRSLVADPLRHHGDRETTPGLLDFAVNVHDAPRPDWLDEALRSADLARYPDSGPAQDALAAHHARPTEDVLPTAGAAEAFGLVARLRPWRRPVVVHPQFTEPDVALTEARHRPHHVLLDQRKDFALDPDVVPADADLVVIGNPTNPTGVRHPADAVRELVVPGRLLVVDEAFLDDGRESLAGDRTEGLVVVRSLTKLWAIPGIRAGYLVGDPDVVAGLRRTQTPWSVSAPAVAALVACTTPAAAAERQRRLTRIEEDRAHLFAGLDELGIPCVTGSSAPFVLARPGAGVHAALRNAGIAVRRGDTFPGLGPAWVRIAVRPREWTDRLLAALASLR
ncbi:MAG TPA: cobyrinate a,c-diamide synthase [Marmoricola sp.]|nr:cobyrinate a,c-diamide synthase [Marmoricola sp.]